MENTPIFLKNIKIIIITSDKCNSKFWAIYAIKLAHYKDEDNLQTINATQPKFESTCNRISNLLLNLINKDSFMQIKNSNSILLRLLSPTH